MAVVTNTIILALIHTLILLPTTTAYVDFGTLTKLFLPTPSIPVPRPHQLPIEWQMRHSAPQHPMITAVAPVLTFDASGTQTLSWSTAYHAYSKRFQNVRGVFKRQNGVFQGQASLLASCTPCASGSGAGNGSAVCYPITRMGILAGLLPANTGTISAGALAPVSTSAGLPCCPVCTPISNATVSATITSGVLATPADTTSGTNVTITQTSSVTVTLSGSLSTSISTTITITVVNQTSTITDIPLSTTTSQVTLSTTTITPNSTIVIGSPTITAAPVTVVGCGTASGSGTVRGSGTVFLGPGGIFPVVSSGIVSGFASKVIGCGTIEAFVGSFEGQATVTGCGTASGCAVLTGIGTVFPDALGGFIGITSSGVASGCGKVVGCGTLIGSGTFILPTPMSTTITPTTIRPPTTVNVYISYCPPDPTDPFNNAYRIGNKTHPTRLPYPHYLNGTSPAYSSLHTNSSSLNSTFTNPLCNICPSDSGICCPLFAACGADGHCPYSALRGAGYIKFGFNVVDWKNSSASIGMERVEGRIVAGLPEPKLSRRDATVRRSAVSGHGLAHRNGLGRLWRR